MHMDRKLAFWLRGLRFVSWIFLALMAMPVMLAILLRTRARAPLRHFNKRILNPLTLRIAGRSGPYAVLHHVGRRSGTRHDTPLVAERINDGFLIPLVYGSDSDWVRNVLAAGRCKVEVGGVTFAATQPRIVPFDEAVTSLRRGLRLRYRFYGVKSFLRLHADLVETPRAPAGFARRPAHAPQMAPPEAA